jgi:release factor glutamine methyltransferase
LDFINELDLTNKSILELGCGSGIISLFAASKGGVVTASDINPTAIDFLNTAASKNELKVNALFSDLFQNISQKEFDYIIINPPYYPKNPSEMKERAWFCGEDFIYFENLFLQLIAFIPNSSVLMILSEDCQIETIKAIASKNKLEFLKVHETKVSFERNFIFSITKTD